MIDVYLPREIERLRKVIPEKMEQYYKIYSYDADMEKYTHSMLSRMGIKKGKSFYQDCLSNTYLGYMYSVGKCAYSGYTGSHVKNYIRLMIRVCIICGIYASDEVGQICKENQMKVVYLDVERR